MNTKKNQPCYTEAMKSAIADIMEECHNEGKCFIAFKSKITKNINIIIGSNGTITPDPTEEEL